MKTKHTIYTILAFAAGTACAHAWVGANGTDFVKVGDTGNAASSTNRGSVAYEYSIGKYTVTNSQYIKFLNCVKTGSDTAKIYTTIGDNAQVSVFSGLSNSYAGIVLSDTSASGIAVREGFENKPASCMGIFAAAMYCNWLSNGASENSAFATGVYDFETYGLSIDVLANADRSKGGYFLPTVDEWYKAAYYDGEKDKYYLYATMSDEPPTATAAQDGEKISTPNTANFAGANSGTTDVGTYENSASFYGTFDQNGNVCEYIETVVGTKLNLYGGGFNSNTNAYLNSDGSGLSRILSRSEGIGFGFRVSTNQIPEPSTYAAVFGVLALAFAVRRRIGR